MKLQSLALSLLLLALFTLLSVVNFEISTHPQVSFRKERELFYVKAFSSDYQSSYSDDELRLDSGFKKSVKSVSRASSSCTDVASSERTEHEKATTTTTGISRSTATPNLVPSGQQEHGTQTFLGPTQLLWASESKPKMESPTRENTAGVMIKVAAEPNQHGRLPGMRRDINERLRNSTDLVRRVRYANKKLSSASRMQTLKLINPQAGGSQHKKPRMNENRNITSTYSAWRRKHINRRQGELERLGLNCTDPHCTSYLLDEDYWSFTICQHWTEMKTNISHSDINATCKFMKGLSRLPVGLVSVPGSGNTWVRELLETVTGICTGSIYCDHPLRNAGMIGEYVKTGRVLVVKTHTSDYQWHQEELTPENRNEEDALYGSAILLIRNPFKAFVAEWNRLNIVSAYSGSPIDPKKAMIRYTSVQKRQKRQMPFTSRIMNNGILQQALEQGIVSKLQGPPILSLMPSGWINTKNNTVQLKINNHKQMSDHGGRLMQDGALPLSRRLMSIQSDRLQKDTSHTSVIDKRMFGELVFDYCKNQP